MPIRTSSQPEWSLLGVWWDSLALFPAAKSPSLCLFPISPPSLSMQNSSKPEFSVKRNVTKGARSPPLCCKHTLKFYFINGHALLLLTRLHGPWKKSFGLHGWSDAVAEFVLIKLCGRSAAGVDSTAVCMSTVCESLNPKNCFSKLSRMQKLGGMHITAVCLLWWTQQHLVQAEIRAHENRWKISDLL